MKIIYNKVLPPKGFAAINLFTVLFARAECMPLRKSTINHEAIHTRQQVELLFVFFYVWYFVEWLFRLIEYRNGDQAYRNISFEREAYEKEEDSEYVKKRKIFGWLKYL